MAERLRAALYRRVSTEHQADYGVSLEAQAEALRRYAASQGWIVVADYCDVISGTRPDRPGLQALLKDAQQRRFDVVLLVEQERLTRLDVLEWEVLKRGLKEAGVLLATPSQGIVRLDDADDEFLADLLALLGRREARKIGQRVARAKALLRERGEWVGGRIPYGYRRTARRTLEPDPTTAPYYREAVERVLRGESVLAILHDFRRRQVPAPHGRAWHHSTLLRMLKNPVYAGTVPSIPPLCTPDEYRRVQELLDRRGRRGPVKPVQALLSGMTDLTECGVCGQPIYCIHKHRNGKVWTYYYCRSQSSAMKYRTSPCDLPRFRAEEVDEAISSLIGTLVLDEAAVAAEVQEAAEALRASQADYEARLQALQARRRSVEQRIARYLDAFEAGELDAKALRPRLEALEQERQALLAEEAALQPPPPPPDPQALLAAIRNVGRLWNAATLEERRTMLRALCRRITVLPSGAVRLRFV